MRYIKESCLGLPQVFNPKHGHFAWEWTLGRIHGTSTLLMTPPCMLLVTRLFMSCIFKLYHRVANIGLSAINISYFNCPHPLNCAFTTTAQKGVGLLFRFPTAYECGGLNYLLI